MYESSILEIIEPSRWNLEVLFCQRSRDQLSLQVYTTYCPNQFCNFS